MRKRRTSEETKASSRERQRRYRERHPVEIRERRAKYRQTPEFKAKERAYRQRPEVRERDNQKIARWSKTAKGQAYHKKWYAENRERLAIKSIEYRNRPEIKLKERRRTLIRKYGEVAFDVLKRDNYTCQKCGTRQHIHIHHVDGDKSNSNIENLVILCNSCHIKLHNHVPKNLKRLIFDEWIKVEQVCEKE